MKYNIGDIIEHNNRLVKICSIANVVDLEPYKFYKSKEYYMLMDTESTTIYFYKFLTEYEIESIEFDNFIKTGKI